MKATARPYAEALFAVTQQRGVAADVLAELETIDRALPPHGRELLAHPGVRPEAAAALVREIAERASPLVANFIRLLADKRRMVLLPDVVAALRARLDEAEGRVRARLQTARAVTPEDALELGGALARRFGKQVEVSTEVRPELIGGARIVVGDRVLDGSLSGQLAALRRRLVAARN